MTSTAVNPQADKPPIKHLAVRPRAGKPTILHFPLPLELREKIYEYLLGGLHLQMTPRRHWGPKYRFYLAILAVNRTIADEATRTMLRVNTFIALDTDSGFLDRLISDVGVPVVAERSTGSTGSLERMCSLRVTVSRPRKPDTKSYTRTFYLLQQDLPRLVDCSRLHLVNDMCNILQRIRGEAVRVPDHFKPSELAGLSFDFLGSIQTMSPDIRQACEQSLLSPFMRCVCPNLTLAVTGSSNDQANTRQLEQQIAPKTVWLKAMMWDMLSLVHSLALQVHEMVHIEDVLGAYDLIHAIFRHFEVCRSWIFSDLVFQIESAAESAVRWRIILMDLLCWRVAQNMSGSCMIATAPSNNHLLSMVSRFSSCSGISLLPVADFDDGHGLQHFHVGHRWNGMMDDCNSNNNGDGSSPPWIRTLSILSTAIADRRHSSTVQRYPECPNLTKLLTTDCSVASRSIKQEMSKRVMRVSKGESKIRGPWVDGLSMIIHGPPIEFYVTAGAFDYSIPDGLRGWVDLGDNHRTIGGKKAKQK